MKVVKKYIDPRPPVQILFEENNKDKTELSAGYVVPRTDNGLPSYIPLLNYHILLV
jgi:hypothetical protein